MKLATLLQESRRRHVIKKLSAAKQRNANVLSSHNLDTIALVGDVIFDQINGVGSVHYNRDVIQRGFVGMMLPKHFQLFAVKADRAEDTKKIETAIADGYGIGSPFIKIKKIIVDDEPTFRVVGHGGRDRAAVLHDLQPHTTIPVHFILMGTTRGALQLSEDKKLVQLLDTNILSEGTNKPVKHKLQSIWLNGHNISL